MQDYLQAVFNYGFPAVFCFLLYVDMRRVVSKNTSAITRLEITQGKFLQKLNETKTI